MLGANMGGACSDVPCRDKSGLLSRDKAGWLDRSLSPCQYAQCAEGRGKFSLWVTYLNHGGLNTQFIRSAIYMHIGGFQLLDLIIPELKSHVIPYKFKCSHWWKIYL